MTDATMRQSVPAWVWGGGLLAASAVVPLVGGIGVISSTGIWVGRVLFAAALAVFAFGLRGSGSVVARRPLGVTALLVLGIAPLLIDLVTPSQVDESSVWMLQVSAYVQLAITAAAALVAVVQIARASIVPNPWRWAPAWALAVVAVVYAVPQVIGVAVGFDGSDGIALGVVLLANAVLLLIPLALGILAMLLGTRGVVSAPTQIYPPVHPPA